MLIFGMHKGQRLPIDVPVGMPVSEVKDMMRERLGLTVDHLRQEDKTLVLTYAGGDMEDGWVFSDLGIVPGTSIRIQIKENIKPSLFVRCSHNQQTISLFADHTLTDWTIDQVRSLASTRSGLPVGIFRLTTADHREMFDTHRLHDYGIDVGHTILLETWDGWNEFLNLSIMGFTAQVLSQVSGDEAVSRFQLKVALFIAAHFGHVDLARGLLKQGVRSDEPTGYHPARMWCQEKGHMDSLKCPIHEATLSNQVSVLRLFVSHDITSLKAKDGQGQEPLNVALRHHVTDCASFLLSKQWSKVNIDKSCSLHVATFMKLRQWCERAKDRVWIKYGPGKSSLKRRKFNTGSLVVHGIVVDGFSKSPMNGRTKSEILREEKDQQENSTRGQRLTVPVREGLGSIDEPERYFKAVLAAQAARLRKRPGKHALRWQKSSSSSQVLKTRRVIRDVGYATPSWQVKSQLDIPNRESSKIRSTFSLTADSDSLDDDVIRLPPIMQNMRMLTTRQSARTGNKENCKLPNAGRNAKLDRSAFESRGLLNHMDSSSTSSSRLFVTNQIKTLTSKNFSSSQGVTNRDNEAEATFCKPHKNLKKTGKVNHLSHPTLFKEKYSGISSEISASTDEEYLEDMFGASNKRNPRYVATVISPRTKSRRSDPLSVINPVSSPRPFYYHQGVREDELIDSILGVVEKYTGNSSVERAVKILSLADSFSDLPWLCRVRLALNVTKNSLKRSLPRLQDGAVV